MTIIGLCGNIGSGKTLVASMLRELGAAVVDADLISRQIVEPGQPAYEDIKAAFGAEYFEPNGQLNRAKLGKLVFNNNDALLRLNAIMHPRIRAEAAKQVAAYVNEGYPLVVLEAALLLHSHEYDSLVDAYWLVQAAPELIYQRLAKRDGLDVEAAKARLNAQVSVAEQAKRADIIIYNEGSLEELRQQVAELYRQVTDLNL